MGKGYRQGRLGEEIKKIISTMLLKELKDPRLDGMVSVTAVDVTGDGSLAKVYITVMDIIEEKKPEETQKQEVLEAMKSAKGLIRKEIGRQVRLRHTPDLIFKLDGSLDYGRHIDDLLDEVVKHDEK
ncbi:MAG: 30S ribosome-binding factor RbfA [Eubacteriales bacterium]|jgi:ribosome-binding factor A|nr:30S ribosome-binding factor RbfA [Eubacteriales bacterium]NLF47394.1 30S ribosome-binding factor RbfA [Clostridiales bacterium]